MTNPQESVQLTIFSSVGTPTLSMNDFTISRLKMASSRNGTCPNNWSKSSVDSKKCYTFINNGLSWGDADTACGKLESGATLVSIDSAFENGDVTSKIWIFSHAFHFL